MHNKTCSVQLLQNFDGTYKLVIDPIDVWIKKNNEQVQWDAVNVDLQVTMDPATNPFASNGFQSPHGTKNGKSGAPQNTVGGAYKYTLTITPNPAINLKTNGPIVTFDVDPQVVIDDSGPPQPGHKKSAKKKGQKKSAKKKGAKKAARRTKRAVGRARRARRAR